MKNFLPQHRLGGCQWCRPAAPWWHHISWQHRSPVSPLQRLDPDSGTQWLGPTAKHKHSYDTARVQVAGYYRLRTDTALWKQKWSYAVQFIADDFGVAFVVVSARHSELQRPEQTVVNLNTENRDTVRLPPAASYRRAIILKILVVLRQADFLLLVTLSMTKI